MNPTTPPPVIVVYGALRSGTTLLRLMLDGHPKLQCPGEADFIFDALLRRADGTWTYAADTLEDSRIYRANKSLLQIKGTQAQDPHDLFSIQTTAGMTTIVMLHRHIDRVLDVFPDMPIIHLLRDPRDVARSSIGMGWAGDVYHGVQHWRDTEATWHANTDRMADGQTLTIRYEDLIAAPEENLQSICAFAGLDYDPAMLNYDATSTYGKPDASRITQWKRKLTARDLQWVEGAIGPLLRRSGYDPSGETPRAPSGQELARLKLANRISRWRHRISRHGLRDPLIVALAGRLGRPGLGRAAQRRIDVRTARYLK